LFDDNIRDILIQGGSFTHNICCVFDQKILQLYVKRKIQQ